MGNKYQARQKAEMMAYLDSLTNERCYYAIPSAREKPWELCIVEANSPGYFPLDWNPVDTEEKARAWADELNSRMGITRSQAMMIVTSSMRVSKIRGR